MSSPYHLQKNTVLITVLLFFSLLALVMVPHHAYAHFSGVVNNVGKYQIIFEPRPLIVTAGENATLNFSILEDGTHINNVYASVIIKEKNSGKIVDQVPYSFYHFSDFRVPYVFQKNTDYVVTLMARILPDPTYRDNPLVTDFNTSVLPTTIVTPDQLLLVLAPAMVGPVGITIFLFKKKKATNDAEDDDDDNKTKKTKIRKGAEVL